MTGLPSGWTKANFSDLVGLKTGPFGSSLHQSDYVTGGVPLVNPMHIVKGRIRPSSDITVSLETVARLREFCLQEGDLVLARRGEMGRCAVVRGKESGWMCGTGSLIVRPDSRLLDASYLQGLLSSAASVKYLLEASVGSTMANLNQQHLLSMDISLPPLQEQLRIVGKLDEVLSELDAGEAELKAAQKKLSQYRQSLLKAAVEGALTAPWRKQQRAQHVPAESGAQLLQRILTERRARWEAKQLAKFKEQGKAPPKDWQKKYPEPVQPDTSGLSALPEGWVWSSVDQLCHFVRNGISRTPNTEGRGHTILRINAVRPLSVQFTEIKHIEATAAELADYAIEDGDLLATRYNGSVDLLGVVGLVRTPPPEVVHPDKLIRMKPVLADVLPAWLEVSANTGSSRQHIVRRVKTTAGQTGIAGEDLKKMPIPLPPLVEQEEGISVVQAQLEGISVQAIAVDHMLKQSTAQRQNILRAAFSGQLVPQDPNDEPASELLARVRAERAVQTSASKARGRRAKEAA